MVEACREAFNLIDLRHHSGGHPRLGAVDLVPIHPISEETSLEECQAVATNIGRRLLGQVPGSSFFFFRSGVAGEDLVSRRRRLGWFRSELRPGERPDLGEFSCRRGVTGAGSAPYMSNFNISLDTKNTNLANTVLTNIRQSSGGLPGVSAMAFPHQQGLEIACNVDMFLLDTDNRQHQLHLREGHLDNVMGQFWRCKFEVIQEVVERTAGEDGVRVLGDSVIIGFTPEKAREMTLGALESKRSCLVTGLASSLM